MMSSETEYDSTNEALILAEKALASLKRKVYPLNPEKFRLLSAPYLEYIYDLRQERDRILGLDDLEESSIPFWIKIAGPSIEFGRVPLGTLSNFLTNLKTTLQRIAEFQETHRIRESGRPNEEIRKLSNIPIRVLPGSIRIGLEYPKVNIQTTLDGSPVGPQIDTAVEKVVSGLRWVVGDPNINVKDMFPDPKERYLLLTQIKNFVPKENGDITQVSFYGAILEDEVITLNSQLLSKIDKALYEEIPSERICDEGIIREIDLDKQQFYLRNRNGEKQEILCTYPIVLEDDAARALNSKVKIMGVMNKDKLGRPANIAVEEICILDGDE